MALLFEKNSLLDLNIEDIFRLANFHSKTLQ